ncbi:MAG: hypothetical protein ACRCUT_04320, partial [Spirochaetota bacterium]
AVETTARYLFDTKQKGYQFGYSDLINNNGIISTGKFSQPTRLTAAMDILSPSADNTATFFFAAESYKKFHALRIYGTKEKIEKAAIIRCELKDTTLPLDAKNNFVITVIDEKPLTCEWGKTIAIDITVKKQKKIKAKVNDIELSCALDAPLADGSAGFSHQNNLIRVHSVKVQSDGAVLFEDDFSADRIKRATVKAVKVPKQ